MNARTMLMHCPRLDQLNYELIETYRSLDDREVFAYNLHSMISVIHAAMEEHRRGCPICNPAVGAGLDVKRSVPLH